MTAASSSPETAAAAVCEDEVRGAVENELGTEKVAFIHQSEQRGTGDAVMVARPSFESSQSTILILSGDVPLIKLETLCALRDKHRDQHADCTILTVRLENPTGYGRIIRDDGKFLKIIEQNDATDEERSLRDQLAAAIQRHAGNLAAVARDLGKDRTQIRRWMKRFGLERD